MEVAEEIRYLLLAVQREGNRALTEALRPLGLTPSQAEVLRVLQDYQPLSLGELGGLLVCESGSPSRLVGGLVSAGLVERIPSSTDGRAVTLSLTPFGEGQAKAVREIEVVLHQQIMRLVGEAPVQEMLDVLWRFLEGRPAGMALAHRKLGARRETTPHPQ